MTAASPIRLGTRGSPLALWQANEVKRRLIETGRPESTIEIVVIRTTGDQIRDRPLADLGGKGLFTKEIEEALTERRIDAAVHSMKDVPTWLPPGLVLVAMLPREDPRDVLLTAARLGAPAGIAGLPPGATVGTASLRRQAQLLHVRPDLRVVLMRGNVETRLRKLEEGAVDATLLALAGLKRLGIPVAPAAILSPDDMVPAVAQGVVGLEIRADDAATRVAVAPLDDPAAHAVVAAERAMLGVLDGSCRTPIGGLATLDGDRLTLEGLVAMPDGSALHRHRAEGSLADPVAIGLAAGRVLREAAGPDFFKAGA